MTENFNIACQLHHISKLFPSKRAVVYPSGRDSLGRVTYAHCTFKQLDEGSSYLAYLFAQMGISQGMRVLLFLPTSLDFSAVVFALFKLGAIPIFMDPGMGRKNLFKSIKRSRPEAMIAVPMVARLAPFFPKIFHGVRLIFSTGNDGIKFNHQEFSKQLPNFVQKKKKIFFPYKVSLPNLLKEVWSRVRTGKIREEEKILREMKSSDTAAILFTSGGTGPAKGVVYTHHIFNQQIKLLQEMFQLTEQDIDCPGFPLFSLFTMCMGMTSCIPDMDPRKPAACDPKKIVETLMDQGVTFAAGSPAIWERVADYCLQEKIKLPQLLRVVMFGAPVSLKLHEKWQQILTSGTTYTPYGATECLPITNISGREILSSSIKDKMIQGWGTCVGKVTNGMKIEILSSQYSLSNEYQSRQPFPFQVGEILVTGPVVTSQYDQMEKETVESKIKGYIAEEPDELWHRMGDVGFLDDHNNLWFCGRKVHQLITTEDEILFSDPVEAVFNQHPKVTKAALIGLRSDGSLKKTIPALVVEENDYINKSGEQEKLKADLLKLALEHPHTQKIKNIYFTKKFPVDIRHNIKIDRLKLRDDIEKMIH